jgi:hypothetical protein
MSSQKNEEIIDNSDDDIEELKVESSITFD